MGASRFGFIIALILAFSFGYSQIDSCTTISSPGEYRLSSDLIDRETSVMLPSHCILIVSSDVVLDCAGHTLTSTSPTEYAVLASNPGSRLSQISVRNCVIKGYQTGISFMGVDGGSISGNSLENGGSEGAGVGLNDSTKIVIEGNVEKGRGFGFSLLHSSENIVRGNVASDNEAAGFHVSGGGGNELRNNSAFKNRQNGGFVISSDSTVLDSDIAFDNTAGFNTRSCNDILINNSKSYSNEDGFVFYVTNSSSLINSIALNNSGFGLAVSDADNLSLFSLTSCSNFIDFSADSNLKLFLSNLTCDSDVLHRCNHPCNGFETMPCVNSIILLVILSMSAIIQSRK